MPSIPALRPASAALLLCAACASYEPEPVDLAGHRRAFAERLARGAEVRAFAADRAGANPIDDPAPGAMTLGEARLVALCFAAEPRLARARAGITAAARDESGRLQDPELRGDVARILESVQYPWLAASSFAFTVPLTGRQDLERQLATSQHRASLVAARLAEAQALDRLDAAWIRFSAAEQRTALLRRHVAELAELHALADRLQQSGAMTLVDARTFALEHEARELELGRAETERTAARLACLADMGLPPQAPLELAPQTSVAPRLAADAAAEALPQGPRLAAARAAHATAEQALALAVDAQYPQLTLAPGWQEEDGQPRAALGFALPLPLWNRNARAIAEARASRAAAAEELRIELERAEQDFAAREQRCRAAQEQRHRIATGLVPLSERQLTEAAALARRGQLDALLLLDALRRVHDARLQLLDATTEEALADVERNALFWPALAAATEEKP